MTCVSGGLYALWKQQIIVDNERNPSEIDIPLVGRIKTNYPSLVSIFLGVALALYVSTKLTMSVEIESLPLVADLTTKDIPLGGHVIIAAFPQKYSWTSIETNEAALKVAQIDVDEPGPYSAVAFAFSGIDEQGQAQYSITQGPAVFDKKNKATYFFRPYYRQKNKVSRKCGILVFFPSPYGSGRYLPAASPEAPW